MLWVVRSNAHSNHTESRLCSSSRRWQRLKWGSFLHRYHPSIPPYLPHTEIQVRSVCTSWHQTKMLCIYVNDTNKEWDKISERSEQKSPCYVFPKILWFMEQEETDSTCSTVRPGTTCTLQFQKYLQSYDIIIEVNNLAWIFDTKAKSPGFDFKGYFLRV